MRKIGIVGGVAWLSTIDYYTEICPRRKASLRRTCAPDGLDELSRVVVSNGPGGTMATVIADMSMSLDGFIADRNDDVGPLFDWYRVGPVTTPSADKRWSFHTSEASAKALREFLPAIGAPRLRAACLRLHQGVGRSTSSRVSGLCRHPQRAQGLATRRRTLHVRDWGVESAVAQAKVVAGDKIVPRAPPSRWPR